MSQSIESKVRPQVMTAMLTSLIAIHQMRCHVIRQPNLQRQIASLTQKCGQLLQQMQPDEKLVAKHMSALLADRGRINLDDPPKDIAAKVLKLLV